MIIKHHPPGKPLPKGHPFEGGQISPIRSRASIMSDPTARVTLRKRDTPDGEVSTLQVHVAENGDLVVQGYDAGPEVEAAIGHEDTDFTRTIKREHVARITLELIADRFTTDAELHAWLEAKGISSDTEIWP